MREMDPQPASLSPNPESSSSASRGMTVSAVARIFIVFLMVFGPYLGSLFSFSWQILPAAQAADTASVSSDPVSTTNTGPVRSPIRAPQPRVTSIPCPAYYPTNTTPPPGPVKGVFGQIFDKNGSNFLLYFTATLRDANNYSVVVTTNGGTSFNIPGESGTQGAFRFTTQDDATGQGGNNEVSNPAPSNRLLILQFDGLNNGGTIRQTSYFDYFKGGGLEVGRYSQDTATRFFLASDCTAYALIDHQAAVNQSLPTAPPSIAVNNGITLPANTDIITMTNDISSNNNRTFDGIIIQGRNIGGRLFQDYGPGNTNPPPYYPYPGGDVSIAAYKSPLTSSQPVTFTDTENPNDNPSLVSTQIVDAEGYYNLFGRDDTRFIPANATASYLLRLRGQTPGQLATELYCSYFYRGQTTEQSNGFQISYATVVTTSATGPQGPILTPPTTGNTVSPSGPYTPAPCYSSVPTATLHQPGFHFVVRGDIQIRGTITMTGRTDPSGAYAAAIDPATKQVAAVSDPVASDGKYKILNLRPGTVYGVEFFPPAGTTNPAYVPSFYNGKELDQTPTNLPATTVAVGSSTIAGIDGTINKGWAFKGTVSFNPGGGGVQASNVQVQVFKTADLLGNALNPVPLTQVAPDSSGNYTTDSVMEPGISYTLAFVPNNTASGYKVSWCGSDLGSGCQNGGQATAAAAGGHLVSSSEGGAQRQIGANVTLFQGVQLAGTINGAGDTALHLSKGGGAAIYIYQVGLSGNQIISSSLAQYFGVDSNSNSITYTSAAVEIGQNYVIQAVPTNNDSPSDPGDPGYRSGYYCGTNCGNGNYGLNQAAAVVGNSPGVVGNLNITLSRAAAITVQLYTYRYDPITNTTAYYPNVAVSVYSKAADQSTPGAFPLGTGLTGPNGTVFIKGLPVESPAAYPYGQPYHIYFSPLGAGSDVSGTLQGVAAYNGGSTCGFPASDVNVAAGSTQSIVCKMPPFAGINGRINPTLTPTGNAPGDWHDVTLQVFDNNTPSTLLYSLKYDPHSGAQNSFNVGYYTTTNSSFWAWSALLPPGNYRFEMVPDNILRKIYLPHWYVSAASNGASAADAIVANLVPDFAQSNANFNFLPGGVLSVKVTDDTGQVLQASTVAYYAATMTNTCDYSGQPQFSIPVASQGPLTGYAYSIPYSGSLCILATPPPNSPYQSNKAGPFSLLAGGQVTIVTYTIQLKPTPFVSGYVRVRTFDGVSSYETPIISASVVAVDLNNQSIFGSAATSDGNGFYRLPLPTGAFKLLFIPVSGTINYRPRYWVSTAAQDGTPSFDQAEVIVPVPGKTYTNYNQIYDVNQIGGTDCQIINPYVSNLVHDSTGISYTAQVVFYTTCPGDTRVTYNNVPTVVGGITVSNSQQLSVFTHTYSVGPLGPGSSGTTYYLYPSSNMVYIANQGTANETRTSEFITATTSLQVFVPVDKAPTSGSAVDGTNWFFAQGQTSSAATSGISETLFLANYHPITASVTITYYGAQGALGSKSLTLKPNSRLDINLDDPTNPNSLASILVNGAPYYGNHSTWVQSSAPIVVERFQTAAGTLNGYPYRGGYNLAGSTTPATTAWFPDIRTFSSFQQSVTVFNPNSQPVCVGQFYNLPYTGTNSGAQTIPIADGYLVVPPFSQKQIDPNYVIHSMLGDKAPGTNLFSLQLRSVVDTAQGCAGSGGVANPIVAELQTLDADPSGSTYYRTVNGVMGGQTEGQTWYLLDGQSDKVTNDRYIITNKSGLPTTVTITFQVDNPISPSVSVVSQTSFVIPPHLRYDYSVPFTQLNRSLVGRQVGFTSRIDADQTVIVMRTAKFVYNSAQSQTGLYQEMGVTQPSDEWLFAAGDTSASADGQAVTDEGFNLYNPNLETVVVSFTYYYRVSGSTVPTQAVFGSYILPALSRTTIKPALPNNDIGGLQPYATYPSVGVNKYFAVQVNSSRAVFAERVLYFTKPGGKYGGNASYGWNPPPGSR